MAGAEVGGILEVKESDEAARVLAVAGLSCRALLLLGFEESVTGAAGGLAAAGCPGWRMELKVRRAPLKRPRPLPPLVLAALFCVF